jgi:hypothetical protein
MFTAGARLAIAACVVTVIAGCGGGDGADQQAAGSATTVSTTTAATTPTTSPTSTVASGLDFAVGICTEGLTEPDQLIYDAALAARAGTRTPAEIADAFRTAQDAVQNLSEEAVEGGFPNLGQVLRDYADVLGVARVSGGAGLTEINDAREQIDVACLMAGTEPGTA